MTTPLTDLYEQLQARNVNMAVIEQDDGTKVGWVDLNEYGTRYILITPRAHEYVMTEKRQGQPDNDLGYANLRSTVLLVSALVRAAQSEPELEL